MKFFLIAFSLILSVYSHDVKGFDDSVLFNVNWPGDKLDNVDLSGESFLITSSHNEKYTCHIPKIQEKESNVVETYNGPTALELLAPLFQKNIPCSYRLDTYWTYEVCHGRHIRQYHEDREGKTTKIQEYILGKWDNLLKEKLLAELKESEKDNNAAIPTKKIDGNNLPYFEIIMGNGTLCELNNNKPRQTSVIYVCYMYGKNEIYSLKESSTCQYEIVVLSPLLCSHPKYKPQEVIENAINCLPVGNARKQPYNLLKLKSESRKLRRNTDLDHIRVEFLPLELAEKERNKIISESPSDFSPVENFLNGKTCLNGGTGWWKYEFCYGKTVEQYHIERDGSKTSINLGKFDKDKHLEWIQKNPHKRPKPQAQRTQLSHFYSDGSVCDKTGKARQTEVKLKCLDIAGSPNKVSLYLLEPKYCEYILGVESPLICDILQRADENGLIQQGSGVEEMGDDLDGNIKV